MLVRLGEHGQAGRVPRQGLLETVPVVPRGEVQGQQVSDVVRPRVPPRHVGRHEELGDAHEFALSVRGWPIVAPTIPPAAGARVSAVPTVPALVAGREGGGGMHRRDRQGRGA